MTGPRLEQRPIDGEMLGGQQLLLARLGQHGGEKALGDVAVQQPLAILRVGRRVPDLVVQREPDKPLIEQVVLELLDQLALTPNAIEHLQHAGPQQLFGRNRRAPRRRVQALELRRQPSQRRVDHRAHRTQRMIGRYSRLRRDVAEQIARLLVVAAHGSLPSEVVGAS